MNSNHTTHFAGAQVGGKPPLTGSILGGSSGVGLQSIRVLVCDDHPVIVSGLSATLRNYGIEVVGEVGSSTEIVTAFTAHSPDVVLLDIRYGPGNPTGLEVAVELQKISPNVRIVFYSQFDSDEMIREAYRLRCSAFVTKNSAVAVLVDAIKRAHGGKPYFLPDIAERLAILGLHGDHSPQATLEPRDFEVFKLLAMGFTQDEIAQSMNVTPKTINFASRRIKDTLKVVRTADLTLLAVKHHIISVE
jgi:two-component system, NarL family, invasion response regulator UvrY